MKVTVRVDASRQIGSGHVLRCLTLAKVLRERGIEVRFICRAHSGNLIELIRQEAMPVTVISGIRQAQEGGGGDDASWLGAPQDQDAEQTIAALEGERADWLIVDHYGIDAHWERRLRPHAVRLLVIDDLANRPHECDLLLNLNYSDQRETLYAALVPVECRMLLGPRYALLDREYSVHREVLYSRSKEARRILVFFGASDSHNMTALALQALSAPDFRHLEVDVVVGRNNPHRRAIEGQVSRRPLTTCHGWRGHLADLMVKADLAFGAGGSTTWERLCLGLPAFVISIADNQIPASVTLANEGLVRYLGSASEVSVAQLRAALHECIRNPEVLGCASKRGQLLVDGIGALRVAEVLDPTARDRLQLRAARPDDVDLYYHWANDPEVRRQAINAEPIAWKQHQEWFAEKLMDTRSLLFVLHAGALPVGQIRFDYEGQGVCISYSLDALVRGRGWATRLVSLGVASLPQKEALTVCAKVKAANHASRSVFTRLGFKEVEPTDADAIHVFFSRADAIRPVG